MRIQRLGELLGGSLRRLGVARHVEAASIVDAVNSVLKEKFGPAIGRDLIAQSFSRGEIRIESMESMAAARLQSEAEEVLRRVRLRLPGVRIDRLRIVPATNRP